MTQDQNHPLYSIDRDHIDRLLAIETPGDADLIDLARLIIRYKEFPGVPELKADMLKTLNLWGFTQEALNERVRAVWDSGFRPGSSSNDTVGSGFDTSDKEGG